MQTGDTNYIYKIELDKACFQHDIAYSKYKDLQKRAQSDTVLKQKAFEIAANPKYDGYQRGLASMVYIFFQKKTSGGAIKNEIKENQQLANELHRPIIRRFTRKRVYSSFKNNIFAKGYAPNSSGEMFVVKKLKKTLPWTYVISDLNGEEIVGSFYEKELQKTNQKEFRIEKVIKRKGNKLYVKWK